MSIDEITEIVLKKATCLADDTMLLYEGSSLTLGVRAEAASDFIHKMLTESSLRIKRASTDFIDESGSPVCRTIVVASYEDGGRSQDFNVTFTVEEDGASSVSVDRIEGA